ncbi:MAG: hypothetical protein BECKG1743D_GA0114223_100993 [Candidatus Kentron sp. G]|nr:MAG: hypothetical protein BECKG1743F_GA0114225_100951 [Candidatus Kentron sp. G]VFM96840.1 MAG: hypothetical protein BECKG1743E_GA0114224_100921 [Candidatus Kentron sp. G]VFM99048.1 MAG: hypothetical protein BECKG1743D_GA0114223_100993 [Candidatus Kentron sp. G]
MPTNPLTDPLTFWLLLGIFLLIVLTAGRALVVWWRKEHYTREYFAVWGFGAVAGLVALFLAQLLLDIPLSAMLIALAAPLAKLFGLEFLNTYQPPPISPLAAVISTLMLAGLFFLYYRVHRNWRGAGGAISREQYEREGERQEPPSIAADMVTRARALREPDLIKPYGSESDERLPLLEGARDSRVWHEKARHLWLLGQRNYLFGEAFDEVRRCWFGQEKNTGALVVLACHRGEEEARAAIPAILAYLDEVRRAPRDASGAPLSDQSCFPFCQPLAGEAGGEQKIEFIFALQEGDRDHTETVDGIDYRYISESRLLDDLVDFTDYFQDIRYRVERERLPDSDLTLQDTYTPSHYRLSMSGEPSIDDLEVFIHDWLTEKGLRQLALLGEYGQGKTSAALLLSHRLIQRYRTDKVAMRGTRIPVLLELRGKGPRSLTPAELLATWAHPYGIDTRALLQLLIAGRVLLILEGFDEMDLTGDTEARLGHFRTLWQLSYPKTKILITGRPNFFLDDAERKSALGIQRPSVERPYCQSVRLAPFNREQIAKSLRATDAWIRAEILDLAKPHGRFYEIVSRPSLLHIVSTLWQREDFSHYQDRINSALVMDRFIYHSYRRQGAKQGERAFMALNTAERAYFMAGVAAYMGARRLPNQIDKLQLDEAIRGLIRAIPDEVSRGVTTMENEVRLPLRSQQRYDWKNREPEIIEYIKTDVRACGLLVSDPGKDGSFKFAHHSFMDFLQAQVLSQLLAVDDLTRIAGNSITNTWKIRIDDLHDSPDAMTFLAELLEQRFREQGQTEHALTAKKLFTILVWGKLQKGYPWKSVFQRPLVAPALWSIDVLMRIFGVLRRKYVLLGLSLTPAVVAFVGAFIGAFAGAGANASTFFEGIFALALAFASTFAFLGALTFAFVDAFAFASTLALAGALAGAGAGVGADAAITLVTEHGFQWAKALFLAIPTIGFAFLLGLWIGFCTDFLGKQKMRIWRRLHLWYRACKGLRLEPQAMERTVGKGVVQVLEAGDREGKE